jgi:hypothetical protein
MPYMRLWPKQKPLRYSKSRVSKYLPVPGVFLALLIVAIALLSQAIAAPGSGPLLAGPGSSIYPNPAPGINRQCNLGFNIALVIDDSDSMSGSLGPMRDDLHTFITSISDSNGSLSSGIKVSMTYFASSSLSLPPVALTNQAAVLNNSIDRLTSTKAGTNWTSGLSGGYSTLSNASVPRLVIIMTDGQPTSPINGAIDIANSMKQNGVRMMGIGIEHSGPAAAFGPAFAPGGTGYTNLQDITNGSASAVNSGAFPDIIIADVSSSLGTELRKIAHGVCVGAGVGGNGNGIGNNGNGVGNNGTGTGISGAGIGVSPQSPSPSPVPSPSPSATVSDKPNPAPTPKAQGTRVTPPPPPPSPFYDGKQYSPGSDLATFSTTTSNNQNIFLWAGGAMGLIALLGLGGWLWTRRGKSHAAARRK